jgi:hypothetical protein
MCPGVASNPAVRRCLAGALALAAPILLAGCGDGPPPEPLPSDTALPTDATPARAQLAALAAAAKDRKLAASYILSVNGRTDRTVTVTAAADGSWRVDVPEGALGDTADVSVAQSRDGLFQCALPSALRPIAPTCVRVGAPGSRLSAGIDPRIQHPFVDWPEVLTDRQAPLSVSTSEPLSGVRGTCFSVDTTSASLSAPLDVGIYCYEADGTLTGARLAYGTLVLSGSPAPAPPTITLPGEVVSGEPLRMAAPPASSPSATSEPTPGG